MTENLTIFTMNTEEQDLWKRVLTSLPDKPIYGVEIGCLFGDSANFILNCNPNIKLISIDPFIPDSMEQTLIGSKEISIEKNKEFSNRWKLAHCYSYEIVDQFKDDDLDFIFIDGSHTYEGCFTDFVEWEPKLKVGGLLFMHDCRMSKEDGAPFHIGPSTVAYKYIYDNVKKWEIVDEAFSLLCVRKVA